MPALTTHADACTRRCVGLVLVMHASQAIRQKSFAAMRRLDRSPTQILCDWGCTLRECASPASQTRAQIVSHMNWARCFSLLVTRRVAICDALNDAFTSHCLHLALPSPRTKEGLRWLRTISCCCLAGRRASNDALLLLYCRPLAAVLPAPAVAVTASRALHR